MGAVVGRAVVHGDPPAQCGVVTEGIDRSIPVVLTPFEALGGVDHQQVCGEPQLLRIAETSEHTASGVFRYIQSASAPFEAQSHALSCLNGALILEKHASPPSVHLNLAVAVLPAPHLGATQPCVRLRLLRPCAAQCVAFR